MTGVRLDPRPCPPAIPIGAADSAASGRATGDGFAEMLARLSVRHRQPEEDISVPDLSAMLGGLAAGIERLKDPGPADPLASVPGVPAVVHNRATEAEMGLAALFNEFGLFGHAVPAAGAPGPIGRGAPQRAAPSAGQAEPSIGGPAGDLPAPSRLGDPRPAAGPGGAPPPASFGEPPAPRIREASPPGSPASPRPRTAAASPSVQAASAPRSPASDTAPDEMPPAPPRPASKQDAGGSGPPLLLSIAEQEATLVGRLERLGRDDRLRLRLEVERLLAAYGLTPAEIRINGAVERRRST